LQKQWIDSFTYCSSNGLISLLLQYNGLISLLLQQWSDLIIAAA
jgi:hypothetical protein